MELQGRPAALRAAQRRDAIFLIVHDSRPCVSGMGVHVWQRDGGTGKAFASVADAPPRHVKRKLVWKRGEGAAAERAGSDAAAAEPSGVPSSVQAKDARRTGQNGAHEQPAQRCKRARLETPPGAQAAAQEPVGCGTQPSWEAHQRFSRPAGRSAQPVRRTGHPPGPATHVGARPAPERVNGQRSEPPAHGAAHTAPERGNGAAHGPADLRAKAAEVALLRRTIAQRQRQLASERVLH